MSSPAPTLPHPTPAAAPAGAAHGHPAARLARRLALDTLYLVLALPAGIVTFTVVVTGWSLGLGLLITLLGLPVILATIVVGRWMGDAERRRAALVLGAPVPGVYQPLEGGFLQRLRTGLGDLQTLKDLVWHVLLLGIGIADFTIAVTAWGTAVGLLTVPAWWWALPQEPGTVDLGLFHVHSWGTAFLAMGVGAVALPVAAALVRATALGSALLSRALLGGDRAALEARVSRLAETREGAVSAAAGELERLERDLHDGAQARLVAVAMELGLAEERLADAGGDPVAREQVTAARDETRRALAELRDLARGMRPGLLAERGLEQALRSLAARGAVPAVVRVALPARPPATVESAAYYVAAEALANAGKHAQATRATIEVAAGPDRLVVLVADDGRGGADPEGRGLDGLRKRVEALDGSLVVTSPAGAGTHVRAELPCAW